MAIFLALNFNFVEFLQFFKADFYHKSKFKAYDYLYDGFYTLRKSLSREIQKIEILEICFLDGAAISNIDLKFIFKINFELECNKAILNKN